GNVKSGNIFGIQEGGRSILYKDEDPYIREYYAERLKKVGQQLTMPENVYREAE
ncbi:MAG: hypothetical protein JO247_12540, partial [Chloroflexi bacterium]|nr:hypothetical protein [Chloroflexota bacterium]